MKENQTLAIIAEDFVSTDLTYCNWFKRNGFTINNNVKTAEILEAIEQTIKILKNLTILKLEIVVMYLAIKGKR